MKRLLNFGLTLALGATLGHLFDSSLPKTHAGRGGGGGAVSNGDVNGDQTIDISDAVSILEYLFFAGPAPVPCSGGPVVAGVTDTGQTRCYDGAGRELACDGSACPGQDAVYQTGLACPVEGRFTDNGDGTVTDNCTGLMWQRQTADVDGDGGATQGDRLTWCEALDYCEKLDFAGYQDWRLPNIKELLSIVDYGRINPAIHPVFEALSWGYWSSTTFTGFPGHGWSVVFDDGDDWGEIKGKLFGNVRAVRSAF